MIVDVSPDGEELLFDLLGDIYTVPSAVRADTYVRLRDSRLTASASALLHTGR